jgi:hypothetical protein
MQERFKCSLQFFTQFRLICQSYSSTVQSSYKIVQPDSTRTWRKAMVKRSKNITFQHTPWKTVWKNELPDMENITNEIYSAVLSDNHTRMGAVVALSV